MESTPLSKVLLVDDDEDDFILVRDMLSINRKYSLEWASSYYAGQAALRNVAYDAVLVDYDLGAHNGLELIREATTNNYQGAFILFTGRGSNEVDMEAMKAGASLYLTKGETSALMLERGIRYAIERKYNEKALAQAYQQLEDKSEKHKTQQVVLESTFDAQQDMVLIFKNDGTALRANPAFKETYGFNPIYKNIREIIQRVKSHHIDGRTIDIGQYPTIRSLMGEKVNGVRFIVRRADGTAGAVEVSSNPLVLDGSIRGSVTVWHDITEQLRVEEVLRKREERYRRQNAILEGINRIYSETLTCETEEELGVICLNVAEQVTGSKFGFIGEINPETGKLDDIALSDPGWQACQMTRKDGEGKRVPMGFTIQGIYGRVLKDGKGFYTNDPSSHPDSVGTPEGHPALTAFLGVPLISGGQTIGMIGLGNREGGYSSEEWDAAEALAPTIVQVFLRLRASLELRRSKEEFETVIKELKTVMDATPAFVWTTHDEDARYMTGNQATYDLVRMKTGENISKSAPVAQVPRKFKALKNGQEIAPSELPVQRAARGESIHNYEFDFLFEDGQLLHMVGNAAPLFDDHGNRNGAVGAFIDITERKRAEQELQLSQKRIAETLESISDGFFAVNRNWCFTYINQRAAAVIGMKREDLIGKNLWEAFPKILGTPHETCYRKVMAEGVPVRFEMDGVLTGKYYDIRVYPSTDGISVYWVDVTEQKQVEAARTKLLEEKRQAETDLAEYAERLEKSNQELKDFAFVASHDLQEPLGKIEHFGHLLMQSSSASLGETDRDYLEQMQSSAVRMRSMIEDLLVLSRVMTRGAPFTEVDLSLVAQAVINDLEGLIQHTSGAVELSPLPILHADPTQMHQLLQNLVANALKFHQHDVPPVVRLYAHQLQEDQINILVEDNGIGFSMDAASRLFQPFQRLHSRSKYEGSGMGLSICRKIVERHRGSISVNSEPGKGSTFIVTLPVKP